MEWCANNTLQLLRFAHENAGVGEWTRCAEDTPVLVDAGTPLCALDLQEPVHPRLSRLRGITTTMSEMSDDPSDDSTQDIDTVSQDTYPSVSEPPAMPAPDNTPPLAHEMMQVRPAASSGVSTEAEWLETPRPLSPLAMPEFRRD